MFMSRRVTNKNDKSKLTVIEKQADYGIYVWQMDHNGKAFGDGRGNVMNIPGRQFDLEAMSKIKDAAKHYNAPAGKAIFMPGVRRVSEMEHSEQIGRMKEGHIASETDVGAWIDAKRGFEAHGE